jgi:probable F420-dependent oxidoreductase
MQLGRLGVWYGMDKLDATSIPPFLATIEALGYSVLWYPESRGFESFTMGGFLLGHSTTLKIGSSIANIYGRDPFTAQRGLVTLNALYGGRFILGLGVSHKPMVETLRGHEYEKPIPVMRAYLEALTKDQDGAEDWKLVIAALRPKMLALAGKLTRGAIPYNTTPAHTAQAAKILGPAKVLAIEQKVCLETNPATARAIGRRELARYMAMDNYRNSWLEMGFTEADLADGGSDRWIDAMVLWGDAATVRGKLREHFDAGATHVCIQPIHADGDVATRDAILAALADT